MWKPRWKREGKSKCYKPSWKYGQNYIFLGGENIYGPKYMKMQTCAQNLLIKFFFTIFTYIRKFIDIYLMSDTFQIIDYF